MNTNIDMTSPRVRIRLVGKRKRSNVQSPRFWEAKKTSPLRFRVCDDEPQTWQQYINSHESDDDIEYTTMNKLDKLKMAQGYKKYLGNVLFRHTQLENKCNCEYRVQRYGFRINRIISELVVQ